MTPSFHRSVHAPTAVTSAEIGTGVSGQIVALPCTTAVGTGFTVSDTVPETVPEQPVTSLTDGEGVRRVRRAAPPTGSPAPG